MKRTWLEKTVIFLLVFASFEGYIRRHIVPYYHGYVLVFKDIIVIFTYLLFVFKGDFFKKIQSFFGPAFFLILWLYLIWNIFKINSPYGFLAGLIGFKSNLLYLPLLFVGYYIAYNPYFHFYDFLLKSSWPVFIVLFYAIFQILTGYDTCISNNVLGISGGYVRAFEGGIVLTVASTLYGGLLAPYGLIWFIVSFYYLFLARKKRYFYFLNLASFFIILIGNNRTTLVALVLIILFTFLCQPFLNRKIFTWLFFVVFYFFFFIYILKSSTFLNLRDWIAFMYNIFDPQSRASVTVNFIEGLKIVLKVGGIFGIGLGSMSQGVQYIGKNIDPTSYGLFGTESMVHRMIIELGIIGLLLYVFIYILLFIRLFRLFLFIRYFNKTLAYIPLGAISLLISYLLLSYKHHGFATNATIQIYTYIFIGIFAGFADIMKRKITQS